MYEIQKTTNFRYQYNKLNLRFKRFVEEAIEAIKESPLEAQGKITHLGNKKDGALYRYRLPGCYLHYVVPPHDIGENAIITMIGVQVLH